MHYFRTSARSHPLPHKNGQLCVNWKRGPENLLRHNENFDTENFDIEMVFHIEL
jgi:hypothetical protein